MRIQPIQNTAFSKTQKTENPGRKIYNYATGIIFGTGVCCLASDRLFKSPKHLSSVAKFGFWATWASIAMVALGACRTIYNKAMADKPED